MKIACLGFSICSPGTEKTGGFLSLFRQNEDQIVSNINEADVLIYGASLTPEEADIVYHFKKIRIIQICEPIEHFSFCQYSFAMFRLKAYDYAIGLISDNSAMGWIKFSLSGKFAYDCKQINQKVASMTMEQLYSKRPCTLISRHDAGNSRVPIFMELAQLFRIDCPGRLLTNCSNEEVDRIGNIAYIEKYAFNICSENFASESYDGYISEKLPNCCLAGAIPIYYGKLDENDKKIYNTNRILLLTKENVSEVAERVKFLCQNPTEFLAFYRQPVYLEGANAEYDRQYENLRRFFQETLPIKVEERRRELGLPEQQHASQRSQPAPFVKMNFT